MESGSQREGLELDWEKVWENVFFCIKEPSA